MSMKQEKMDSPVYPPPPPLLQQGMRPNQNVHGARPPYPMNHMPGQMLPRPPILQPSPGAHNGPPNRGPENLPSPSSSENAEMLNPEVLNSRIDKASIKGTFGWETIDTASIPCIFRDGEKYVSVRMVEQKLLSKYPSTYPAELRERPPLMSQFITLVEANLLNEINVEHCACEFGQKPFTEKDLVVSLKDFGEFYKIVKKHFPREQKKVNSAASNTSADSSCGGGWVQINNTVVPFIKRHSPNTKELLNLAPLPVLKYAAGLLNDIDVPMLAANDEECKLLSDMCRSAGLDFNFAHNTSLILLQQLPIYCSQKIMIKRLSDGDPFGNAEYSPELDQETDMKMMADGAGRAMLPTIQDLPAPVYHVRPEHPQLSTMDRVPPPNVTVQPGSMMPPGPLRMAAPGTYPHPFMSQNRANPKAHPLQAMQAMEKMAGPPSKKQKTSNFNSESTSTPRASPNQPGHQHQVGIGRTPPPPYPPGMPPYVPGQFPQGVGPPGMPMMPHPGMMQGPRGMWPSAPRTPAEMQQLAEIMNMQAAILSGNHHPPIATPQNQSAANAVSRPSTVKPTSTQSNPVTQSTSTENTKSSAKGKKSDPAADKIQPVDFHGKKISCLVKGDKNEKYALIEAISRVYFPNSTLDEFIKALVSVLQVPIYQLDREEEKSFISFYGLPTSSLKCSKVLNLVDLDQLMPQLKYMFKMKEQASQEAAQASAKTNAPPATPATEQTGVTLSDASSSQDTNNNADLGTTSAVTFPPVNPFGRTNRKGGGFSSKLSSKLEDAVNRLRQKNMKQMEGHNGADTAAAVAQNGTNEIGQGQIPRNPFLPRTETTVPNTPNALTSSSPT